MRPFYLRVNSSGNLSTIHSNALFNTGDAGHMLKLRAALHYIHHDPRLTLEQFERGNLCFAFLFNTLQ
jgi:hypothetical protein